MFHQKPQKPGKLCRRINLLLDPGKQFQNPHWRRGWAIVNNLWSLELRMRNIYPSHQSKSGLREVWGWKGTGKYGGTLYHCKGNRLSTKSRRLNYSQRPHIFPPDISVSVGIQTYTNLLGSLSTWYYIITLWLFPFLSTLQDPISIICWLYKLRVFIYVTLYHTGIMLII